MKVALVHDDLVQWGGAERVLLALSEVFPDAPIYTSVYNSSNSLIDKHFSDKKIITSFIQQVPFWKDLYKTLLPLYPLAFESFDFSEYDLVISHTTRFAKSIITKPETKHICYIHTPPRFLWSLSDEKYPEILEPLFSYLRIYDVLSSKRVDYFFAGSKNCQSRVKKVYGKNSQVLYPFVDLDKFNLDTYEGGYYLIISRLNKYKKIDIAVNAFNKLGLNLKIIGDGPQLTNLIKIAKSNINFLGKVSEGVLINVLSGCKALIVMGEEDFGLTPLEAQALGKPVIAYAKGGALETVTEKTGILFSYQDEENLIDAISKLEKDKIKPEHGKENAQKFSKEQFVRNLKQLVSGI